MTIDEFNETKLLTGYCKKCIVEDENSIFRDLIDAAPNIYDFKVMLKSACAVNNEVMLSKTTAEILKDDWHFLRDFLGYKSKRIDNSDLPYLRVGNSSFSINIPNGRSNALTRYAFLSKDEVNTRCFIRFGSINGRFFIYDKCSEDGKVLEAASGRYEVFYKFGMIIFVS